MIFAVAASILIMVGVATWAFLRPRDQHIARAVLDLRNRSMARSTSPPPTEPPLEVSHNLSNLEIYLPLGSSDGPYDVRLATTAGEPLVAVTDTARIGEGITTFTLKVDLSSVSPGLYVLQLRKAGSEWNSFALRIR
jgi:hypothetical protein